MKKLFKILPAALWFGFSACSPSSSDSADPVLAAIDKEPIRRSDLQAFFYSLAPDVRNQYGTVKGQFIILEMLINNRIILEAAGQAKFDDVASLPKVDQYQKKNQVVQEYSKRLTSGELKATASEIQEYSKQHAGEASLTESQVRQLVESAKMDAWINRKRATKKIEYFDGSLKVLQLHSS